MKEHLLLVRCGNCEGLYKYPIPLDISFDTSCELCGEYGDIEIIGVEEISGERYQVIKNEDEDD